MRKFLAGAAMAPLIVFMVVWVTIGVFRVLGFIASPTWGELGGALESGFYLAVIGVGLWVLYRAGGFRSNAPVGNLDQLDYPPASHPVWRGVHPAERPEGLREWPPYRPVGRDQ